LFYIGARVIASRKPADIALAEADAGIQTRFGQPENRADAQNLTRRNIPELPAKIAGVERRIGEPAADTATHAARSDALISVAGRACNQDDLADIVGFRLKRFPTRSQVGGASRWAAGRSPGR
jgi:hypothetical protein